jgi:hypothetical protein
MKFRTTINIITDAEDKNEAMDIAGEYLSGNINTGVDLRLRTSPVRGNVKRAGTIIAAAVIIGLMIIPAARVKHHSSFPQNLPGDSVIQPPLKTSAIDAKPADFKREWRSKHAQEALSSLKR